MVLQEIATFLEAEKKLVPVDANQNPLPIAHRIQVDKFKVDKDAATKLRLQEAILVGNYQNQVRIRMLPNDYRAALVIIIDIPCLAWPDQIFGVDFGHV